MPEKTMFCIVFFLFLVLVAGVVDVHSMDPPGLNRSRQLADWRPMFQNSS
jgi:hypothetical protein